MHSANHPLTQDVVLVGGGHTHALVLRKWAMSPLPGARLTLINPHPTAPYTGMLPGFVAGHYARDALDIDMVRLARAAGARLILDRAAGIDAAAQVVTLAGGRQVRYDALSVDIGITAPLQIIEDASGQLVPVKPMDSFADKWERFRAAALAGKTGASVTIIGGGVGGVEIALAIAHALRARPDRKITLLDKDTPLGAQKTGFRSALLAELARAEVQVMGNTTALELKDGQLFLADGTGIASDFTISAAGAAPYPWLQQTGLPLEHGFLSVTQTLQVKGHDQIFAAGDCAHLAHAPRPKAGVFAVRAAPVLFDNLRAVVTGGALRAFNPQSDYLKIVSLGAQRAIAEKWGLRPKGPLMWRLKDHIDQKFMRQFTRLRPMAPPAPPVPRASDPDDGALHKPLCAGCGAKVAPNVLTSALRNLPRTERSDILSGPGDDAAILAGPGEQQQVITTDHLRAFCDDPYLMAKIAATHAMGDIWAMGAQAQAALPHIILPRSSAAIQADMMREIMAGATEILHPAGAQIVGGHSSVGAEMTIGYTLTGLTRKATENNAAQPGDALILCKRIGSGTLLAGEMAMQARGAWIADLLAQMATPQSRAADHLAPLAHAMTDVTGFGLAGHLNQMAQAAGLRAILAMDSLPIYDGAVELAALGIRSSLYPANRDYVPEVHPTTPAEHLLFDPQTAGGLLASLPADTAKDVLRKLHDDGVEACQIGEMQPGTPGITLA